jgi:uncharacterized membrane protein
MAWIELAAALTLFFLSHSVPVRPPVRGWFVERLGRKGFTIAYSVLSLAVLAWLIIAAGRAPFVQVWAWAPWQNDVVLAAMLVACLILALAAGKPNPFSFGGSNAPFDPSRPGIMRWIRHPVPVALALWSASHMLANGDVAHVVLFGTFTLFAIAGQKAIDKRKRRELGAKWDDLRKAMGRHAPSLRNALTPATALRIAAGLALYLGLLSLHPFLIGVSPWP